MKIEIVNQKIKKLKRNIPREQQYRPRMNHENAHVERFQYSTTQFFLKANKQRKQFTNNL